MAKDNSILTAVLVLGGAALMLGAYSEYKRVDSTLKSATDSFNSLINGANNAATTATSTTKQIIDNAGSSAYMGALGFLGGPYSPAAQYANDLMKGYRPGTTGAVISSNTSVAGGLDAYNQMVDMANKLGINMPKVGGIPLFNPFR